MTRAVFVDTSAWYALADAGDAQHLTASETLKRLLSEGRTFVTTNYVVSETYTLLRIRLKPGAAHEFLRRVRSSMLAERHVVPESWQEDAEELPFTYRDQDFSYVDATSFVTMRRLGIQEAFAFDHHFAILGFSLPGER